MKEARDSHRLDLREEEDDDDEGSTGMIEGILLAGINWLIK